MMPMKLATGAMAARVASATLFLAAFAACGSAASPTPEAPRPTATALARSSTPTPADAVTAGSDSTPATAPTGEPQGTANPPISLVDEFGPPFYEFEGDADDIIGPFIVSQGVLIVFMRYTGEGDFTVSFADEDDEETPLVKAHGPYSGERLEAVYSENVNGLVPGQHRIKIEAGGPWRVRLLEQLPSAGQAPSIQFGGVGDGGGAWIRLDEGSYTIRATHDGESRFKVMFFESKGIPEVALIDQVGPFDEVIPLAVTTEAAGRSLIPGLYAVGVLADGIWAITLEDADAP